MNQGNWDMAAAGKCLNTWHWCIRAQVSHSRADVWYSLLLFELTQIFVKVWHDAEVYWFFKKAAILPFWHADVLYVWEGGTKHVLHIERLPLLPLNLKASQGFTGNHSLTAHILHIWSWAGLSIVWVCVFGHVYMCMYSMYIFVYVDVFMFACISTISLYCLCIFYELSPLGKQESVNVMIVVFCMIFSLFLCFICKPLL